MSACSKIWNDRVVLGKNLRSLCFRKLEKGTLRGRRLVAGWDRIENWQKEMRLAMWRKKKKVREREMWTRIQAGLDFWRSLPAPAIFIL